MTDIQKTTDLIKIRAMIHYEQFLQSLYTFREKNPWKMYFIYGLVTKEVLSEYIFHATFLLKM